MTADIVEEEWLNSGLDIEVDTVEMGLYLAIIYDRQELSVWGLRDVTSTWVSKTGPKPGITMPEVTKRGPEIIPKFAPPVRQPTLDEKKIIGFL